MFEQDSTADEVSALMKKKTFKKKASFVLSDDDSEDEPREKKKKGSMNSESAALWNEINKMKRKVDIQTDTGGVVSILLKNQSKTIYLISF